MESVVKSRLPVQRKYHLHIGLLTGERNAHRFAEILEIAPYDRKVVKIFN